VTKRACTLLLIPIVFGCGSTRESEDSVPRVDRICDVVLDEPITATAHEVSIGQTAAGDVLVHENGRLHVRTAAGWTEDGEIPEGTSGSELVVSPNGTQALLADNYSEMMLWARTPGEPWKRIWIFDEHDGIGERALAFAGDDTLFVTVRRRYYAAELYRLRLPELAMEQLEAVGESASMTLWAESPMAWWWAYWAEGAFVHHGERLAQIPPGDDDGAAFLTLTAARGLGVLAWGEVASYEAPSGAWTAPRPVAASRVTECPEHDSYDETREGETCAIDDDTFGVTHVGGDALDLVGTEATAIGVAEWRCNLDQHGGSCNWSRDVDERRYLVAGRRDGSFDRLIDLGGAGWYTKAAERGPDGDVHLVLGMQTNDEKAARYVRLSCQDRE
jgi:hypothetical protein